MGMQRLREAGIENARGDARALLLHTAGLSPAELIGVETETPTDPVKAAFMQAIEQRAARIPLQHILKRTFFYGLELSTDPRALIPRPDSEQVVGLALSLGVSEQAAKIADLGAGSGALLLALLDQRPAWTGIAVEQSASAITLIEKNILSLSLGDRARCFHGSWTEWTGWGDCDLIISNPPYIRSAVIPTLAPEVRDHDPIEALDGGPDGLEAYREIIALAAAQMTPGAFLVLEIGYDQKDDVTDLLNKAGFIKIQHQKDLGGQDRAIAAKHP